MAFNNFYIDITDKYLCAIQILWHEKYSMMEKNIVKISTLQTNTDWYIKDK